MLPQAAVERYVVGQRLVHVDDFPPTTATTITTLPLPFYLLHLTTLYLLIAVPVLIFKKEEMEFIV